MVQGLFADFTFVDIYFRNSNTGRGKTSVHMDENAVREKEEAGRRGEERVDSGQTELMHESINTNSGMKEEASLGDDSQKVNESCKYLLCSSRHTHSKENSVFPIPNQHSIHTLSHSQHSKHYNPSVHSITPTDPLLSHNSQSSQHSKLSKLSKHSQHSQHSNHSQNLNHQLNQSSSPDGNAFKDSKSFQISKDYKLRPDTASFRSLKARGTRNIPSTSSHNQNNHVSANGIGRISNSNSRTSSQSKRNTSAVANNSLPHHHEETKRKQKSIDHTSSISLKEYGLNLINMSFRTISFSFNTIQNKFLNVN